MTKTIDKIGSQVLSTVEYERSQYAIDTGGNGNCDLSGMGKVPGLPEVAWQGFFADYRALMGPTTEAPDEFHFGVFCQVLSCIIGRMLHVYHAGRQYPNFFIGLVGQSGLTRKDTAMNRGEDILSRVFLIDEKEENPGFRIVRGIRSFEGLLAELEGQDKTRLIMTGELLSLMAKARQDSTGNLIPQLTELYDCKEIINPPVLTKKIVATRPFVSIIAGTTQAWLAKALTTRDILGGFANRWCYFCGNVKPPSPNPPKMDHTKRDELIRKLVEVRSWASEVPGGELIISPQAAKIFAGEYYRDYYYRCQSDGIIPTLLVRIQDHCWKLALLYAAMDFSHEIKEEHIRPAIAVAEYLEKSAAEVFSNFNQSHGKEQESRVLECLRKAGGPKLGRDIYRELNISSKELNNIADNLLNLGLIKVEYSKPSRGPRAKLYSLVFDATTDRFDNMTG